MAEPEDGGAAIVRRVVEYVAPTVRRAYGTGADVGVAVGDAGLATIALPDGRVLLAEGGTPHDVAVDALCKVLDAVASPPAPPDPLPPLAADLADAPTGMSL